MVQHPIPRQITTFEFKLIGFLTLKQFLYLVTFIPSAFVVYKLIPIPLIRESMAILVAVFGFALALIPINDRPLDLWIKNLCYSLTSPTQFVYQKESKPLYFLEDLVFLKNPHIVASHIESKDKLNAYLQKTAVKPKNSSNKHAINVLLSQPTVNIKVKSPATNTVKNCTPLKNITPKKPFLMGTIKNNKKTALPGILVYIKNQKGETLRILKSNLHGVFAAFTPIAPDEYMFEIKDPKGKHFFATMKKRVEKQNPEVFEFYSKKLI